MSLHIRQLSKSYDGRPALKDLNLDLDCGVVALLGANGSGKSTLLRILATLVAPDQGEIHFNGLAYHTHQQALRMRIAYLPQEIVFSNGLTPRRLLAHLAALRGANFHAIARHLRIDAFIDQPLGQLSSGQIRLVGIAQAFLGMPQLLLLDELTHGLDISQRGQVMGLVRKSAAMVLFSTHLPDEVAALDVQTLVILHQGNVRFVGSPQALCTLAAGSVYALTLPAEALPMVQEKMLISRVSAIGDQVHLRVVGPPPPYPHQLITPSIEDSYLFLTHFGNA